MRRATPESGAHDGPVRAGRSRRSHAGLRTAALVLMATALPVVSLLWASGVGKAQVESRALEGLAAVGKATLLHEQQVWDDAVHIIGAGASRPPRPDALGAAGVEATTRAIQSLLLTGPFADVRVFDAAGNLVAMAARPSVTPTPVMPTDARSMSVGDPITVGTQTTRQVGAPVRSSTDGPVLGRLVVDVDVTQLLGNLSDLGFDRTGTKLLVTRAGMVVAGSGAVGTTLRSPENRAIAAAGRPVTRIVYSPRYGRLAAESYEPIPGQDLGIFIQQARAEIMGGADHLAALMRWVALVVGVLGTVLAAALGVVVGRRSRHMAASDRRLADSEAESRRRLEQFVEAMPIGIFVATPNGRPYYANHEAERLLGRGIMPEARAEDLTEIYSVYVAGTNDLYPSAELPVVRALAGEACHVEDIEIHRDDGTLPVEVWGTPVLAGDGSVVFGVAAFIDVAERRHAMEEVQFLSAITANMAEGVLLVRAEDSTIAYANSSLEAMFGYEPAELVGRDVADLSVPGPDSSKPDTTVIIEALREDGAWQGEVESVRKDGSRFWRAVNATAIDHPRFGPVWISVSTDVTARRQALEAQARFASIVQASTEAILAKTLDGVVTSWNPGAETLLEDVPNVVGVR